MKKFKKAALTAASYVSVAALAIGGTVAFFTDDEKVTNVMPLGEGVNIALLEQQRGENGLEGYEQGKELIPIVGSAQNNNDEYGLAKAENYVDKIVRVENIGETDAYVRVLCAFPVAWDADEASDMPIHWNHSVEFDPDGAGEKPKMGYNWKAKLVEKSVDIDGQNYNIYSYTYKGAIAPDYITEPAITGFYMDSKVDFDDETGKYTMNGVAIDWDLDKFVLPVYAQAVQVDGFVNEDDAFESITTNPWAEEGLVIPELADSAETLNAAIATGGTIYISDSVELTDDSTIITSEADINLNNGSISADRSNASSAETYSAMTVKSNVTIAGTGSVENASGYGITVKNSDATLTILDGTYKGGTTAIQVTQGELVIKGGTFEDISTEDNGHYLINCIDANYKNGTAKVTIMGGTFKNWNPENNTSEGAGTNFLADGYKVVSETNANGDVWYTVVAE